MQVATRQAASTCAPRILVIDDEPKIVGFVSRALSANSFRVDGACSGNVGLELAREAPYELIILDMLLPDVHGIAVLKSLVEANPAQRVLVLSALSDVASKVRCLELGASDYLSKPFAIAELVARSWALLRRPAASDERVLRRPGVSLDLDRRTADAGAGPVALSLREFLLLAHLVRHADDICTRAELLEQVWGMSFDPGTNVVDVSVRRLRAKLGDGVVETVRNVGYCLGAA
jgi:DNA-binding response OmpR family regulator